MYRNSSSCRIASSRIASSLRKNILRSSGEGGGDRHPKQRSGFVLIVVLVVIAILALSAYTYTMMMQAEHEAAILSGRRVQSRYFVDSGVDSIRIFLSQDKETIAGFGGVYDNPGQFQGLMVVSDIEDPDSIGYVTVIATALDDQGYSSGYRYGLTDESTRLNLNVLPVADAAIPDGGRTILLALPLMTEEIADAIMDFLDEDDEPRDYGAEYDYYAGLEEPYSPANGPLNSVEELLLVKGVTPELLFGADSNHNGMLDENELAAGGDDADPSMLYGWSSMLTLYSKEGNLTADGEPRIFVNGDDLEQLETDLRSVFDEDWVNFIIALRQYGPYSGSENPEDGSEMPEIDFETAPSYQFTQVLDMVDATVEVPDEEGQFVVIESPVRSETLVSVLPLLMDSLTTVDAPDIPGRININQAPRAVLEGIPGINEEIVETIISERSMNLDEETDENRMFETWLLVEGVVDLATMKMMLPFVCMEGSVYRANVVGFYEDGGASSRAEVILDTTEMFPRILFWRNKSHLPSGYDLEVLGVGASLEEE